MIAAERQHAIMRHLEVHHVATTETLTEITQSSLATVRRDLQALADRGLLTRTHGGARVVDTPQGVSNGLGSLSKIPQCEEKVAIARAAARHILPGETVFLGAGQTCTLLAREIHSVPDLKIITTSINSVLELAGSPGTEILLLGGDIHVGPSHIETLDEYTIQSLSQYYFDRSFITVDGIDVDFGYSINFRKQLPLYEYLLTHSRNFSVMVDHSKFAKRAFVRFTDLGRIPEVFTDTKISPIFLEAYASFGVNVTVGGL